MARGSIVAIGGGQLAGRDPDSDTTLIDRHIVRLSGKAHPRVLFFPAASDDDDGYIKNVRSHFATLGCEVSVLLTANGEATHDSTRERILATDIVYVGGGNTENLIRCILKLDLERTFREAYERGVILSGLSAGAMCWFWFHPMAKHEAKPLAYTKWGLGLIPAIVCPHYDSQPELRKGFWDNLPKSATGIGLDDYTALVVEEDSYYPISSDASANVYRCSWYGSDPVEIQLDEGTRRPLDEIMLPPDFTER